MKDNTTTILSLLTLSLFEYVLVLIYLLNHVTFWSTIEQQIYRYQILHDNSNYLFIGIPYDFYNGYILMVAKNVDVDDDNDVNTGSSYSR